MYNKDIHHVHVVHVDVCERDRMRYIIHVEKNSALLSFITYMYMYMQKSIGIVFCNSSHCGHFIRGFSLINIMSIHFLKCHETFDWCMPNL